MRRLRSFFLLILLTTACLLNAKSYRPSEVQMVYLRDRTQFVCDPEHLLSRQTIDDINSRLSMLESMTGIQVVVVVVPNIEGGDCFDFAYQLGKENGVGEKKRDNGLVIVLSTNDRCIQFATGYGLEGVLPDAICKRIQVKYMNPYFKENQWDKGMLEGIKAVTRQLEGSMNREDSNTEDNNTLGLTLILFFVIGGFFIYLLRRANTCPNCRKRGIRLVADSIIARTRHSCTHRKTYRCKYCGYTRESIEEEDNDDHLGGGPFIGGFGRGSIGGFGGGFGGGGGSFGGGSFGGGGAGSKF